MTESAKLWATCVVFSLLNVGIVLGYVDLRSTAWKRRPLLTCQAQRSTYKAPYVFFHEASERPGDAVTTCSCVDATPAHGYDWWDWALVDGGR